MNLREIVFSENREINFIESSNIGGGYLSSYSFEKG